MSRKTKLELTSGDESRHRRRIVDRLNWAVSLWNQLLDKLTIGGPAEPMNFCGTLYIDCPNKRVGIKRSDPDFELDIESDSAANIRIFGNSTNGIAALLLENDAQRWALALRGDTSDAFWIRSVTGAVNALEALVTGEVGIGGTPTAGFVLHIIGDKAEILSAAGSATLRAKGALSGGLTLEDSNATSGSRIMQMLMASDVWQVRRTNDAESAVNYTLFYYKASDDSLGIGHTSPEELLDAGSASDSTLITSDGDLYFKGSAGLFFAEIYANDVDLEHTISGTGQANKIQITAFNANGQSNGATPDHTNDHITLNKTGKWFIAVSMTLESVAGAAAEFGYAVYKNNGATEFTNLHGHRDISGGGGAAGSVTLSGIIDGAENDTIEVWIWNESNFQNVKVDDINLSVFMIGG